MKTGRQDPLVKQLKKAYRTSELYEVDKLFIEQTRWQRKLTIASNKLADVRRRLDAKLKDLATPKGSHEGEANPKP